MQAALDTLKEHCEKLGRDYDSIEKTCLSTVNLSGKDSVDGVLERIKKFSDMGFSHVIFNMPDVYKISPLETFGKEIIPAVEEK